MDFMVWLWLFMGAIVGMMIFTASVIAALHDY